MFTVRALEGKHSAVNGGHGRICRTAKMGTMADVASLPLYNAKCTLYIPLDAESPPPVAGWPCLGPTIVLLKKELIESSSEFEVTLGIFPYPRS